MVFYAKTEKGYNREIQNKDAPMWTFWHVTFYIWKLITEIKAGEYLDLIFLSLITKTKKRNLSKTIFS